jgi:hypothetical protein
MSGNVEYLIHGAAFWNDILDAVDIWASEVWAVTTQPL